MRSILLSLIAAFSCSLCLADDYVVVVMDTSGSMSSYMSRSRKSRMNVAKDALKDVLSKIPPTTKIGIVTFNGWSYKLKSRSDEKLIQAINDMYSSGGTPLYQYMKVGADALLNAREKAHNVGTYKLLVVTDGIAGDDNLNENRVDSKGNVVKVGVLNDILSRGIIVDAIGLDMDRDHTLSSKINGRYMRGDDSDSLKNAIKTSVAEAEIINSDDVQAAQEFFDVLDGISDQSALDIVTGIGEYDNTPISEEKTSKNESSSQTQSTPSGNPAKKAIGIVIGVVLTLFVFFIIMAICANVRGF